MNLSSPILGLLTSLLVPQERVASAPTAFVEVVSAASPATLALQLTSDQPALAIETRQVALAAGSQRLRFDWSRERIDEGSLRLSVAAPARLVAREKVRRLGNMIYLDVEQPAAGATTVEARYLLSGIGWRVDYTAELRTAEDGSEVATIAQAVEFDNHCGRDLDRVRVGFDGGVVEALTLAQGARRRLQLRRVDGVPVTRRYVFDAARFGGTPGVELEIDNTKAAGLGVELLPAGKVRVLQHLPGEAVPRFVGEDVLPFTPIGEKARFSPGSARELTVERTVLFQGNENERRDRWNKVVVYDQKTRIRYKVNNGTGHATTLKLVESPGAPFEIVTPQDGLDKTTADRLERLVALDAGASVEFEIEWLRRDLF